MKIILTGATGYVGEGVLLECLKDSRVEKVLSISRRPCGHKHKKLEEYIVPDLMSLKEGDPRLQGYDAVFFCAGITSVGKTEEQYRPIAYDIPMHLSKILSNRQNMTYVFVSGAGTGKTETAYQLAKATGRDIMMVDIPQIRSMWVGESEKSVKGIFERYTNLVKDSKRVPILLFNEADAIIGKRTQHHDSAADKSENTMQNIILQEMENLNGILIATTNLQNNMDLSE